MWFAFARSGIRPQRSVGASTAPTDLLLPALQDGNQDQPVDDWIDRNVVGTRDRVDDQGIAGRVRVGDPHEGGQAADVDGSAVRIHRNRVVPLYGGDRDRIGLAVGGRAADRRGQIDVDALQVGSANIVHGDRVSPAEGSNVNHLDPVEVHDDVAQ